MKLDTARAAIKRITDHYTHPSEHSFTSTQSLDTGMLSVALLHTVCNTQEATVVERAYLWLRAAMSEGVDATPRAGLFYGVPSFCLVFSLLPDHDIAMYRTLTQHLATLAHKRLETAEERMKHNALTCFAEYDLISGLSGVGAVLLRVAPGSSACERLLSYLVRLAQPITHYGEELPGWWVTHTPLRARQASWQGGHANLGLSHGIAGPLMILALAHQAKLCVPGHKDAVERIYRYYQHWHNPETLQYPPWIQYNTGKRCFTSQSPGPPSWCYGVPGVARSLHLAALALGDKEQQQAVEKAMLSCLETLTTDTQLEQQGLCHGYPGVLRTLCLMQTETTLNPTRLGACADSVFNKVLDAAQQHTSSHGVFEGLIGTAIAVASTCPETLAAQDKDFFM